MLDEFVATCRAVVMGEHPIVEITRAMEQLVAKPSVLAAQIPEPVMGLSSSVAGSDEILFEDESLVIILM